MRTWLGTFPGTKVTYSFASYEWLWPIEQILIQAIFKKYIMSLLELTDFFEAALVYWLNIYSLIHFKAILFTQ